MTRVSPTMPSTLFRTASSTVVLLKDDTLLEVRRDGITRFSDPRTWESQEAWLTAVGEPLIHDAPVSADMKLVEALYRKYRHWAGESGLRLTGDKSAEYEKLAYEKANINRYAQELEMFYNPSKSQHSLPNKIMDLVDGKPSVNPWGSTVVTPEEFARYKAGILALQESINAKHDAYIRQRKTNLATGRFQGYFEPFGKSSLYVGCMDGSIRPVYYNVTHNACGVPGDDWHNFRVGRSFDELGIRPVAWYVRDCLTGVLTKITDLP